MKPELGQLYLPSWRGHPPHMSSLDLPLWDRFQDQHGSQFLGFYFDALVGTPSEVPPGTDEKMLKMWTRLTAKRIDAVGVKPAQYWLIEFRPNAAAGALGTIVTYMTAWRKDPPDDLPVQPVIVSDVFDPDIIDNAHVLGIQLIKI